MQVTYQKAAALPKDVALVLCPIRNMRSFLKGPAARALKIDARLIEQRAKNIGFEAKAGQTLALDLNSGGKIIRYDLRGWDAEPKSAWLKNERYRKLGAAILKQARNLKAARVVLYAQELELEKKEYIRALLEGIGLATYEFQKFKSKRKPAFTLKALVIFAGARPDLTVVKEVEAVVGAVSAARSLINTPPSDALPKVLVQAAQRIARESRLKLKVFNRQQLIKMGAGGIAAVSAGSSSGGYLIHLTYKPTRKAKKKIALVGKGVTFDSGGLWIKPGPGMSTMKCDMSGAAAVLSAMSLMRMLKPNYEVHGYIPTCENMVGPDSMRSGDVITIRNGRTVEVINTDAEGRLILADALSLAVEDGVDEIVSLATLTGAVVSALGTEIAGLMSNNPALTKQIITAGETAGERYWELPLVPEYRAGLKSPIADLRNIGNPSKGAGTILASLFLEEFVDKTPWVHLDIAGTAFYEGESDYLSYGGVGFGVRTLVEYLRSR
jgi:leucyl aminopeptidase